MMNVITNVLGTLLCLTAITGFFSSAFLGMSLNPLHEVLLLSIGAATFYFGIQGTEFQARYTCRTLGVVFAFIGVATLMSAPGVALPNSMHLVSDHVLKIIPGQLELTDSDGWRNLFIGLIALAAGFFPREKEIEIDMRAQEVKRKVASGR